MSRKVKKPLGRRPLAHPRQQLACRVDESTKATLFKLASRWNLMTTEGRPNYGRVIDKLVRDIIPAIGMDGRTRRNPS